MADDGKTFEIEIMREGVFRDFHGRVVPVDDTAIRELAASYDEASAPAPLVLGHPKDNHPAYGWVKGLSERGGKLVATVAQVPQSLRDAVKDGRYRRCSASFFGPQGHGNPKPGTRYLRHIGLLGAATPAVSGLQDVAFAAPDEDDGIVSLSDGALSADDIMVTLERIIEALAIAMTPDQIAELVPQYIQDAIKDRGTVEPASLCKSLNAADAALKARLSSLVEVESNAAQDAVSFTERRNEDFVGELVREGRLAPFACDDVTRILTALDTGEPVSFSAPNEEGGEIEKNPADVLRGLLKSGTPVINLFELSAPDMATHDDDAYAEERAHKIDEHRSAAAQEGRSLSATDAARELGYL